MMRAPVHVRSSSVENSCETKRPIFCPKPVPSYGSASTPTAASSSRIYGRSTHALSMEQFLKLMIVPQTRSIPRTIRMAIPNLRRYFFTDLFAFCVSAAGFVSLPIFYSSCICFIIAVIVSSRNKYDLTLRSSGSMEPPSLCTGMESSSLYFSSQS